MNIPLRRTKFNWKRMRRVHYHKVYICDYCFNTAEDIFHYYRCTHPKCMFYLSPVNEVTTCLPSNENATLTFKLQMMASIAGFVVGLIKNKR